MQDVQLIIEQVLSVYGTDFIREYFDGAFTAEAATPVAVGAGQTVAGIDFTLKVGGRITGTVTRAVDGQPLEGMQVITSGYDSATTRPDGAYTITGIAPGTYKMVVTDYPTAYAQEFYNDVFDYPAATPIAVALGETVAGIDFALIAGGTITGKVIRTDGAPAAGVGIAAGDFGSGNSRGSALTQADGTFTIPRLPPGGYRIQANTTGTGFAAKYYPGTPFYGGATPVTVLAGEERAGIDLQLTPLPAVPGDTNGDGGISAADLAQLLQLMAGDITTLPAGARERAVEAGGNIGLAEAVYDLQSLFRLRGKRTAAPVINGLLSPGEWDDAESALIEAGPGWVVTALYKNDARHLYLAFTNLTHGCAERYPAVLLDSGHEASPTWDGNDWRFSIFAWDCERKGEYTDNNYGWDCDKAKLGWMANNFPLDPSGTVEMVIDYEKLGLTPGEAKDMGLAFVLTSPPVFPGAIAVSPWPAQANPKSPATWSTWHLK